MSKPLFLLWCDLETTGLDPEHDAILEMALVLTTPELEAINWGHWVFQPFISVQELSPTVARMHSENGLWNDVMTKGMDTDSIVEEVGIFLNKILATEDEAESKRNWNNTYLAGSSVHFDRQFLDRVFVFTPSLSHRIIDVSVVRTMLKMWKPEDLWDQKTTHRAVDDIFDHIEEMKYYRNVLGLWEPKIPEQTT